MICTARTYLNPNGQVFLHGELWQATTSDEKPVKKGEQVTVEALDGLRLIVKKTDKKEE